MLRVKFIVVRLVVFLHVFIDGLSVPANIPVRSVPTGMSARTRPSAKTCKSSRLRINLSTMPNHPLF
jgi:hypothetical protein